MKVHYKIGRLLPSTILRLWQRIGRRGLLQLCVTAFVRIIIVVIFLIGVGLIFSPILLFVDVKIPFNRTTAQQNHLKCKPVRIEIDEKFFFGDLYATERSGGVGNFVFEYIALLGIAKQLNRTPAIKIDNEKLVQRAVRKQEHFPNLLEPLVIMKPPPGNNTSNVKLTYNGCCVAFNASEVYAPYENVTAVYSTLIYAQSFVYFDSLTRDEVLHTLKFSDATLKTAELELVEPAKIKDTHNLCVHIRRGDYLRSRFHMPSTEPFTIAGTLYLVEKLRNQKQNRNISVIMLGNDLWWERNIFYNTATDFPFYVANQSHDWVPHIDWAFSKLYCDTVLITAAASTYGWWLSYFSRGQDIYYNEKFSKLLRDEAETSYHYGDWKNICRHKECRIVKGGFCKTYSIVQGRIDLRRTMKAYSYYIKETILPTAISRQRVMRWGFLQLSRAILRTLMLCCFGLLTMTVLSYIRKFHHINTNIPEQTTCPLGVPVEAGEKFYFADMYAGLHSCGVGNIIFEYLAFVGMANELNRTPAVDIKNERLVELLTDWRRHFPNLLNNFVFKRMFQSESTETIKVPLHSCCDSFDVEDVYAEAQDVQSVYTTLVYMQSFVYFQSFTRDEILKLLQFSESTMVDARLRIVDPVNLVGTHNLCVHIRRGDFVNSTIHSQSTEPFTIGATLYLVEKLRSQQQKKNVSVIILGTDPLWEQKLFENTTIDFPFYVANQSKDFVPHVDWAFSKLYCDAVLITASASTYGWWLAYFSRGQNVYYNEHISPPGGVVAQMYQETFFPQEWTRLRLDQTTQQISEVDDWVQDKKMLQRILRKSAKARSKQRSTPNATTVAG